MQFACGQETENETGCCQWWPKCGYNLPRQIRRPICWYILALLWQIIQNVVKIHILTVQYDTSVLWILKYLLIQSSTSSTQTAAQLSLAGSSWKLKDIEWNQIICWWWSDTSLTFWSISHVTLCPDVPPSALYSMFSQYLSFQFCIYYNRMMEGFQ